MDRRIGAGRKKRGRNVSNEETREHRGKEER